MLQYALKKAHEVRMKKKQERDIQKAKDELILRENPFKYVEDLKKRKYAIMDRKRQRNKANSQSVHGRQTVAKMKRMRAIKSTNEAESEEEERFGGFAFLFLF